ncbi:bifunctional riboflavin kinase/FAD synthetase [Pelagibacteraceae bacterium]|jgi:riboflavin kinase / FMN adenylyltransferase|nr:bifunctional riboflavin kinase/FAD synthetase [Pelagibacteraceae bacterium]MDC0340027.1 bifunctional riboflavin kinase/FAD synthetase [Pelagibacteraceae bacterium]MDC0366060.1 bifunctional riboflavin kinase/FAD synthetase [Pelagibacteraceae bacterium]
MKIYKNANLNKKHCGGVIAIGNFDGIHLGHQKVINEARKKARKNKLPLGIMTFEPVPVMFFNSKIKNHRINSLDQKKTQLKRFKLDFLIIIKFNKNFSSLTAEQFIKKTINNKTKCKFLYVSKNFKFGYKRQGSVKILKKYEKLYSYKSLITKTYKINKKIISSSLIRKKIAAGKIKEINKLLNREWSINGKVIKGQKRGRKIGFPTCNIKLNDYIVPRLGVYAVKVKGSKFNKKGIANIGYRPTFNGQNLLLETNIFGINKNLYNKEISISFKKFIRPEKKFKNLEHLKKQIKIDIKKAK